MANKQTRRLLWPRYTLDQWDMGDLWTYTPHRAASDAQTQFARLFGRQPPKRKRKGNR